jgi:hypothetical protein
MPPDFMLGLGAAVLVGGGYFAGKFRTVRGLYKLLAKMDVAEWRLLSRQVAAEKERLELGEARKALEHLMVEYAALKADRDAIAMKLVGVEAEEESSV